MRIRKDQKTRKGEDKGITVGKRKQETERRVRGGRKGNEETDEPGGKKEKGLKKTT